MSYNVNKKARLKDLKNVAQGITAITSDLSSRVADLETLAAALMAVTNASIANIDRGEI